MKLDQINSEMRTPELENQNGLARSGESRINKVQSWAFSYGRF